MHFKPELSVKIVVDVDDQKGRINARNSIIYDVVRDSLLLAQTEPPIRGSMINKEVMLTYVVMENKRAIRYGLPAIITELREEYELAPERYVHAIVVSTKSEPKPYDIRMCYRVGPSSKSGLDASIQRAKINVIDLSIGGMRFSYEQNLLLDPQMVVEIRLSLERTIYKIAARIIRTWETENSRLGTVLNCAAAEFQNVGTKTEQALSRKIRDIERESPFS
jgi:hypothetical protein